MTSRILFLSAETQHTQISLQVKRQLKILNGNIKCLIVDTRKINFSQPTLRHSYKKEIDTVENIVSQVKPDVLVVSNDQGIHSTFIRVCRVKHIPTLAIQDGILSESNQFETSGILKIKRYFLWRLISRILRNRIISKMMLFLGRQEAIPCWGTSGVDKIAVMGNFYKRLFLLRGVSSDSIAVTGYPLLDSVPTNISHFNLNHFIEKTKLKSNKKYILLLTQPFVEDNVWIPTTREKLVKLVVESVKQTNAQLIMKLHPRENMDIYKNIVSNYGDADIFVTQDSDLHELLMASNVAITISSTAGLWAVAYGKPLVMLNCLPCYGQNILKNFAVNVEKIQALSKTLQAVLNNNQKYSPASETNKLVLDHLYLLDGNASRRIAQLILGMVQEKLDV